MRRLPQRIVCLTTETVEVLYALGEQERIAGITGYTVRPPQARKEKPKVYAFTSGDIDKILAVQPDLVLTFSDLQADIARDLIKAGVPVYAFNMRSVDDIARHDRNHRPPGRRRSQGRCAGRRTRSADRTPPAPSPPSASPAAGHRPRVYFEEWDEPNITAVRWVSEMIEIAGGENIFAERAASPLARDRILADPLEVVAAPGDHHRLMVRQALSVPERVRRPSRLVEP
jgi:iron complex transport system substrate-binding protein